MYNEDLKKKFIDDYQQDKCDSIKNTCTRVFNAVEKFEIEWGADICTRKASELQPVIDSIVGFRARSKWMSLIILKKYVNWCMTRNVPDACDGMMQINAVGLEKIREQTVSNPGHLEEYLNAICDPTDKQTTENIYRCYYWLAYAGMPEEDILNVRSKDVDFTKMVVRYDGSEWPIYREAVPAFKNCVELTQFLYKHPNYSKEVWKDRVPGDLLVRGIRSQPSATAMRVELSRRSKKKRDEGTTNLKLSYFRVWISGLFYRTREEEDRGIQPDFKDIVAHKTLGKTYKLDSGRNTQEAKHRQLAHDYLEDYQRWKLAFNK